MTIFSQKPRHKLSKALLATWIEGIIKLVKQNFEEILSKVFPGGVTAGGRFRKGGKHTNATLGSQDHDAGFTLWGLPPEKLGPRH